jgi:hypothetical protein
MPSHRALNIWNFLFSAFFLVVLVAATEGVRMLTGSYPKEVPIFDAILMAFATLRITRLIVYDKIARWFRELFVRGDNGFLWTVRDLLECPWCIGFWSALVIAFVYFAFAWAWFVIFFLALAGAGSLLQIIANGVGWRAETLKLEAKEKGNL